MFKIISKDTYDMLQSYRDAADQAFKRAKDLEILNMKQRDEILENNEEIRSLKSIKNLQDDEIAALKAELEKAKIDISHSKNLYFAALKDYEMAGTENHNLRLEIDELKARLSLHEVRSEPVKESYADSLKAYRQAHCVLQRDLAKQLGVSADTLRKWEAGHIPSKDNISKLIKFFKEKKHAD